MKFSIFIAALSMALLVGCSHVEKMPDTLVTDSRMPASLDRHGDPSLPKDLRCSETVTDLNIFQRGKRWFAESRYFKVNGNFSNEVEVTVTITDAKDGFRLSALNKDVEVHTYHPNNDGYSPFRNLVIENSIDPKDRLLSTLYSDDGKIITTYTCCPAPMTPPDRGTGYCR
jgi:hypothetical protein